MFKQRIHIPFVLFGLLVNDVDAVSPGRKGLREIPLGDDAVSVKSGLHWKTKEKVPAQNYLFERVTILYRNFAIGSDVSGDVRTPSQSLTQTAAQPHVNV